MASAAGAKRAKLSIPRRFTSEGVHPFDQFTWVTRSSRLTNPNGKVIFDAPAIEVPESWSQVAVDVWASKFARKAGVPQADGTLGAENSVKQEASRLANAWMIWGQRSELFASDDDAERFRDELLYMYCAQMASPNSPQHFNTGLHEAYGITGDAEGNAYYDAESGQIKFSEFKHERSAANACFINSVRDDLVGDGGIMDLVTREARLFKAGSGSGTNFSNIRGKGEKLSGGGTSSGLLSFLKVLDAGAGAIKSGGTTRRAAKMVIVDVDHPDIEEFIDAKVLEERKVAALIAAGYDSDYNGEAYGTVAFQNANNSVRISADFMKAVREDADWHLTARTTGEVMKTVKARDLWQQIATAAWQCADPGIQFDDIINDWHTGHNDGRQRGTNPCSEYLYLDDTACNLASLNLVTFYDQQRAEFDVDAFLHAVRLWTVVLEITVSMSHYPSPTIAFNSYEHRTLGLGFANLGTLLMLAGLPYDSDAARAVMGGIAGLMTLGAYEASAELAAAVGPAAAFPRNKEHALRVIRNHARVAAPGAVDGDYELLSVRPVEVDHSELKSGPFANLSPVLSQVAKRTVQKAAKNGLRNMQVTVLAPTGTIGLQMDCDTTGIEPDFAAVKFKKLAGGGYMKIVNSAIPGALKNLGYAASEVDAIITYALGTGRLDGATPVNSTSLREAGLSDEALAAAEKALAGATSIGFAFAPYVVGVEELERLGITAAEYDAPAFNLLSRLGFTSQEISASDVVICGHGTVEGAPGLKPEHLAVFDTANYCGDGTRTIHWSGHVKALGAVAGLISGSVSKTINMPNDATVEDVAAAYELSYELGVKCNAIYRDGSKLSQPLSSAGGSSDTAEEPVAATAAVEIVPGMSPTAFYGDSKPQRFRLGDMRWGPRWRLVIGGSEIYLSVGEYADGTPGEIFLQTGRDGTTLRGLLSTWSILVSQALQHGIRLEELCSGLLGQNFAPHGTVQGYPNIKMAHSIPDLVARVLAHYYLGDESVCQIPGAPQRLRAVPEDAQFVTLALPEAAAPAATSAPATAPSVGSKMDGDMCGSCGGALVRSGTCKRCTSCGETTGCS